MSGSKFKYPDNIWKELCGMMANLVGDLGCNKGQFLNIVKGLNRNFREYDKASMIRSFSGETPFLLHLQTPRVNTCIILGTARADSGGCKVYTVFFYTIIGGY